MVFSTFQKGVQALTTEPTQMFARTLWGYNASAVDAHMDLYEKLASP